MQGRQIGIMITFLMSTVAFPQQACLLKSTQTCCQIALHGQAGTAYFWRPAASTDASRYAIKQVSSKYLSKERVGGRMQWQWQICYQGNTALKFSDQVMFEYINHTGDVAQTESIEVHLNPDLK